MSNYITKFFLVTKDLSLRQQQHQTRTRTLVIASIRANFNIMFLAVISIWVWPISFMNYGQKRFKCFKIWIFNYRKAIQIKLLKAVQNYCNICNKNWYILLYQRILTNLWFVGKLLSISVYTQQIKRNIINLVSLLSL